MHELTSGEITLLFNIGDTITSLYFNINKQELNITGIFNI